MALQAIEKCAIDFVGPFNPPGKKTGVLYIITATYYITRWAEAQAMKDCIADIVVHFSSEQILTRFGCMKILMSDRGMHFVNETIQALMEEFQIHHLKSTPYHPQANGAVESLNKILEQALTKVYNVITMTGMCASCLFFGPIDTCKKLTGKTLF